MKVTIKNAGRVFEIELNSDDTGLKLKEKIMELTKIPLDRQKILIKGGKISDDVKVSELNLNAKQPLMVLGTPDNQLPSKPIEKPVFLEDLNEKELNKFGNFPSGILNMGNTCYLNSSLQTLFLIDEIPEKLNSYRTSNDLVDRRVDSLIISLKNMFGQMSSRQEKITPAFFLTLFRSVYPQFAEREHGFFKQQDAEEAFSQILFLLYDTLNIKDDFKLTFKETQKCIAAPEEEAKITSEDAFKLNCHINVKTNFLKDGIMEGLHETIEKFSESLRSNAEYQIDRYISRLPKYLTVHFVRFYWRADTRKKSKKLRKVLFPFELDMADALDASIKQEKIDNRDRIRKVEKENYEMVRDFKKAKKSSGLNPIEQREEDEKKIMSIKSKFHEDLKLTLPSTIDIDSTPENPSSIYELTAVITHRGSSADSGHYQSFVKDKADLDGDKWWRFDDDKVSSTTRDKIEALAGGGESDTALVLLYKASGL